MKSQELHRIVREVYPYPIARAYIKSEERLEHDGQKLKRLLETAERVVQFLALLALAQMRRDLRQGDLPSQENLTRISLNCPSFTRWSEITPYIMQAYRDTREQLIVPELFSFCFQETSGDELIRQPFYPEVITPLIELRNRFHHADIPEHQLGERVAGGLEQLYRLLEAVQFLTRYKLAFTEKMTFAKGTRQTSYYSHDVRLFVGCASSFPQARWKSVTPVDSHTVVLLGENRFLPLEPFCIRSEQIRGFADFYLLHNYQKKIPDYFSTLFGEVLHADENHWKAGARYQRMLREFFRQLRNAEEEEETPDTEEQSSPPLAGGVRGGGEAELPETSASRDDALRRSRTPSTLRVELDAETHPPAFEKRGGEHSPLEEEEKPPFSSQEKGLGDEFGSVAASPPKDLSRRSPYKFLDYFNPEDHDIFFGRDREIRILQRKFYNSRLLVLHGESGTGKTSLIRAGLIPTLDPESCIPVYVRALQEPLREIERELLRQLKLEETARPDRSSETCQVSLVEVLQQVTERVNKTVVIVLDQFEEFFLRFSDELRFRFGQEIARCVQDSRLDVKFMIALRADYFSYLAGFEESIPDIFTHELQLQRLSEEQALEAILKPAARLGIQIDEAMVQIKLLPELLADESDPLSQAEQRVEPPLLQIVCDALYQNASSEGRQEIGMADYEAIGDVGSCLGRYLSSKLRQFGSRQPVARAVLKALVTTEGTKRASFPDEILTRMESMGTHPPAPSLTKRGGDILSPETLTHDYLDKFVRDRLLRVEDAEGRARYELSHDYLVSHIEAWIKESEREVTKILELIDRAYETFQATGIPLERSALQEIAPYEKQLALPEEKRALLDLSKSRFRKERRGLFLKVAALLMFVALLIGGFLGYELFQAYQDVAVGKEMAEKAFAEAEQQRLETERALKETEKAKEEAEWALRKAERQRLLAEEAQKMAELESYLASEAQNEAQKMSESLREIVNASFRFLARAEDIEKFLSWSEEEQAINDLVPVLELLLDSSTIIGKEHEELWQQARAKMNQRDLQDLWYEECRSGNQDVDRLNYERLVSLAPEEQEKRWNTCYSEMNKVMQKFLLSGALAGMNRQEQVALLASLGKEITSETPVEPPPISPQTTVKIQAQPDEREIEVGLGQKIKLAADTHESGLQFQWSLDGPGSFDGDTDSPTLSYVPPNVIDKETVEAVITLTVSDARGETQSTDQVSLTLLVPSFEKLTIDKLLTIANNCLNASYLTTPKAMNALDVFKIVLKKSSQNPDAREIIMERIAERYKSWGDRKYESCQKNPENQRNCKDAMTLYQSYLVVIDDIKSIFHYVSVRDRQEVRKRLKEMEKVIE